MNNFEFLSWPSYTPEEVAAVSKVLESNRVNYWTGALGREFEKRFAEWVGTEHAVALTNGTLALDVALKALGVGVGDEVVVSPRTFIASVSAVVNAGAKPVFADVDRDTQGLSADTIASVLTERTKAVVVVHLGGTPCDMDPIMALSNDKGFGVIEDCAQAHGATYKGRKVGSIGDIGAWSFCQDKIMSTGGEGGMVTTNSRALWSSMWSYKDHGKSWDAVYERSHPPGFRWLHDSFGTNFRMLEMQAAIGLIQLQRMDDWSAARRRNADVLAEICRRHRCVRVPIRQADAEDAHYRFYAFVEPLALPPSWSRDRIVEEINARGVPCFQGSCSEVYLEKAFDGTGWRPTERLPVAKELGSTSLAFLVHPTITVEHVAKAAAAIDDVLALAEA